MNQIARMPSEVGRRHRLCLLRGISYCLLLVALSGCTPAGLPLPASTPTAPGEPAVAPATPVVIVLTPTPIPGLDVAEQRIIDVYQRISKAVVNITTQVLRSSFFYGVYPEEGSGSGFVYDADGHIITNVHVVEDAEEIMVSFGEGMEMPARIVGLDPPNDLAVLKVEALPPGVEALPLGDSGALRVGQRAIAIGNPFGQFERTLTVGVISAINRTIELGDDRILRGVIQTDASINRGNSGGPLLDSSGRLIGVNTAIFSPSGTSAGVGLAIPVNKVKRVVPVLIQQGRYPHPWLGIERLGYAIYPELAEALELPVPEGLLIARVYRDSPALDAGIRTATREVIYGRRRLLVGGDLLTAIDDVRLRAWDDLEAYLEEYTVVGQVVRLTLWRDGRQLSVEVALAEEPVQ